MPDETLSDEVQRRVFAAMQDADSGSNHQAGVDGDDPSVADRAADTISAAESADASHAPDRPAATDVKGAADTDHPTGEEQAAENAATESPS